MVEWGRYQEAYKAIHDKLDEILAKLDTPSDPTVVDLTDSMERLVGKNLVSVANRGVVPNASFMFDFLGWEKQGFVSIVWDSPSIIGKCCQFSATYQHLFAPISPPAPTNYIKTLSFMTKSDITSGGNLAVYIYYTDGTYKITNITTWYQLPVPPYTPFWFAANINYDANKQIKGILFLTLSLGNGTYIRVTDVSLGYDSPVVITKLSPDTLLQGQKTVASAGTPEALGSGVIVHSVLIQPMPTNTGNITVGNSGGQHFVLTPTSQPIRVFAKDLGDIYIDAANNDEGVNYIGG